MEYIYKIMLMISIICLAGDGDNFALFILWHLVWFAVFLFCAYKLKGDSYETD